MLDLVTGLFGIKLTSALLGGLGGVATYGFLNWNERRIRRDRFRRALLFEIEHIGETLDQLDATTSAATPTAQVSLEHTLSTDLLDADFQSIGKLTTREIKAVYRFYEATATLNETLHTSSTTGAESAVDDQLQLALEERDRALATITRSRLSRATEWYKNVDAGR